MASKVVQLTAADWVVEDIINDMDTALDKRMDPRQMSKPERDSYKKNLMTKLHSDYPEFDWLMLNALVDHCLDHPDEGPDEVLAKYDPKIFQKKDAEVQTTHEDYYPPQGQPNVYYVPYLNTGFYARMEVDNTRAPCRDENGDVQLYELDAHGGYTPVTKTKSTTSFSRAPLEDITHKPELWQQNQPNCIRLSSSPRR